MLFRYMYGDLDKLIEKTQKRDVKQFLNIPLS